MRTLGELCLSASKRYKDRPAFAMFNSGKIGRQITYTQMGSRAKQIGMFLRKIGVEDGGKVLLLSENCPEWPLAYFGIALAGAVSVPLLTGFSIEQIHNITIHCEASVICVSRAMLVKLTENAALHETFGISQNNDSSVSAFSNIPIVIIDSMAGNDYSPEIVVVLNGVEKRVSLHPVKDCITYSRQNPDDLASIIYTSGTQGNSKGVMLSGRNLISSALSTLAFGKLYPRDVLLSVLPLAHSYECSIGFLAPVISGSSITYLDRPPSPVVLLPALKVLRPTVMVTVPILIEKIYRNAIAPKLNNNILYKFAPTRRIAIWFAGRKLFSALGGRVRIFGIGGAPLSPEVEKFLHRAGFPYTIGYGLTETSPLVAGNSPRRFKFGSGIVAAKGVMIRILKTGIDTDEGEIQVKGPNVMQGYYNDKERTTETFTSDGWLRTGDLGRISKKGKLHIRGRLKALILSPSGENIYPEEIEGLLGSSQLVEDVLVYSGEKGELIALVKLNEAAKAAAGVIEQKLEDLRTWVNKKLAVFSRLSRIDIKQEPFEKTPTMKIKRYLYL